MNPEEAKKLNSFGEYAWIGMIAIFVFSLIGIFLVPEEHEGIRKFLFITTYFFGLPVVIGVPVIYADKKGWIKERNPKQKDM